MNMVIQQHIHVCGRRRGITLLEVLIAIGILAIGLSTVVALIPAGRSQAARAVLLDRAGALAANTLSDAATFGLLRPAALTGTAGPLELLVIDPLGIATFGTLVAVRNAGIFSSSSSGAAPNSAPLLFTQGRDDLLYSTGTSVDDQLSKTDSPPDNLFSDGSRAFQGRMSCICAILPPVVVPSVITKSATTTIGSSTVNVQSTVGLQAGMTVTGTSRNTPIPSVTKLIRVVSGTTVLLTQNATSGATVDLTFSGSPGTLSIVVFHARDPGTSAIVLTVENGFVVKATVDGTEKPLTELIDILKPGIVVYADPSARFHQLLSFSIVPNTDRASVTFSTGPTLLSGTQTLTVLPDSVGLAERAFTAEETGPYLQ